MEFRVLGPIEVVAEGQPVDLGGTRERGLLAVLLLSANQVVSVDRLVDNLWGERPPETAVPTLRVFVSRLRKALRRAAGQEVVVTQPPGYVARVDVAALDVTRFEALASRGHAQLASGDVAGAAATLREALGLWRGPALADLTEVPAARAAATRLEEERLAALEERIEADLACGRHRQLVAELEALTATHPLRERLWARRMVALYRSGRQADALRAYQDLRRILADDLGLEPTTALRELEGAILRQDPALLATPPPTVPSHETDPQSSPPPAGRIELTTATPEAIPPPPLPSFLTGTAPVFVGRDAELDRLRQMWAAALGGRRQVALVGGEPGIGKTRLAAEFAGWAGVGAATVLAGRCDEDLAVPFQPFVEALRHFIDHRSDESLVHELGRYGGDLARLVPELKERVSALPPALCSDPETERYRLFDAVVDWLVALTSRTPVLLVLDDLQWAAKPTLLLLRHVARALPPMRLLLLGLYRDTDVGRSHPLTELLADLRRGPGAARLLLTGLDERSIGRVVEAAAGHDLGEDDREIVRAVHEGTDGNPFFVEELLRHFVESGMVTRHGGRWIMTRTIDDIGIPEGVQDVVGRRLSRLSETATRLLTIAAVVGVRFEVDVVHTVSGFPDDTLIDALEEATRARLVVETPGPRLRFRFAHALVRSVVYDQMSLPRRCSLHHRVGEAIEAIHAQNAEDHLPALAHHFTSAAPAGEDVDKAIEYCIRAGDRAVMQLAHHEAAACYRQALKLFDGDRDVSDQQRRTDLLISLGESQRRAGDPTYRETLLEAARAAKPQGDGEALARAALANTRAPLFSAAGQVDAGRIAALEAALEVIGTRDSKVRARLLASLALELTWAPQERRRRVHLSEEALQLARAVDDRRTLAHVLLARQYSLWGPDSLDRRLMETSELVKLVEDAEDPVVSCRALFVRFRAALEAGDVDEAERCLERNATLVGELAEPGLVWLMRLNQTGAVLLKGRLGEAERLAQHTWQIGRDSGQPDAALFSGLHRFQLRFEQGHLADDADDLWRRVIEPYLTVPTAFPTMPALGALLAVEVGDLDEARRLLDTIFNADLDPAKTDAVWLRGISDAAAVCAAVADTAQAALLYDLLLPYAGQFPVFGMSLVTGCADHSLGLLARTLGRLQDAATHFASATALHEHIGAPTWLARTRLEWARLLLLQGGSRRVAEARVLLDRALTTARQLGLSGVERHAIGLLDETAAETALPLTDRRPRTRRTSGGR